MNSGQYIRSTFLDSFLERISISPKSLRCRAAPLLTGQRASWTILPPTHHCYDDFCLRNLMGIDMKNVLGEQDEVSELAGLDGAFVLLPVHSVGSSHGVGINRIGKLNLLLRNPSALVLCWPSSASEARASEQ